MSQAVLEGAKKDIICKIERVLGSGVFTVTSPERRVLDANRALVSGFDWGPGTWDSANAHLYSLFDSTAAGLTAPGTYYMQLRCVIGVERYAQEIRVDVVDWGP